MANLRRLLIFLGLIVLAVLLVFYKNGSQEGEPPAADQVQQVDLSPEEMKSLLEEVIRLKWDGQEKGDWLQVYENSSPAYRAKTTLVSFMQGRDKYYFKNWKLLDLKINGLSAEATIQYDWGVHLDMEIDLGTPGHEGVVKPENYYFDVAEGRWYPGKLSEKLSEKQQN
ncbi:MAG: hypothetical protein KJ645_12885 [Planctomycetes bacterium]|nr:hypothetical protein [Planctomycetota bacterium]